MKKMLLAFSILSVLNFSVVAEEDYDSSSDTISTDQEVSPESSTTNPNWYQNQEGSGGEVMDAPGTLDTPDDEVIDESSDD